MPLGQVHLLTGGRVRWERVRRQHGCIWRKCVLSTCTFPCHSIFGCVMLAMRLHKGASVLTRPKLPSPIGRIIVRSEKRIAQGSTDTPLPGLRRGPEPPLPPERPEDRGPLDSCRRRDRQGRGRAASWGLGCVAGARASWRVAVVVAACAVQALPRPAHLGLEEGHQWVIAQQHAGASRPADGPGRLACKQRINATLSQGQQQLKTPGRSCQQWNAHRRLPREPVLAMECSAERGGGVGGMAPAGS